MSSDPHDLARFVAAQENVWQHAIAELRRGDKTGHWMWFIFPQVAGLGRSPVAKHFAIASRAQAAAYLAHPLLGNRLEQAAAALAAHAGIPADRILGPVDAVKLRSSMTLFAHAADDPAPFRAVLDAFYDGIDDPETLSRLD